MIKSIFSRNHLVLLGLVFGLVGGGCTSTTSNSETPKSDSPKSTTSSPVTETKTPKASKIDINSAPIAELDKLELPGTKPSLSERIEGGRPYKQIDDLVTKKVISAEEFKLIQNLVTTETKK